jgi:hypothetical protein
VSSCANQVHSGFENDDDSNTSWGDGDQDDEGRASSGTTGLLTNKDDDSSSSDTVESQAQVPISFPELNALIEAAIAKLGGAVVPKLNWSCPKDATWVNGGSLKCYTAGDVYVLLKSSDFVMHDILYPFGERELRSDYDDGVAEENMQAQTISPNVEYKLTLRKWSNIHKSMEYRCFVASDTLVAVSQRDHTQFYPYLQKEEENIEAAIHDFFEEIVSREFTSSVDTYVFDCYVDQQQKVWLIDLNVWGPQTDSLLFEWKDLEELRIQVEEQQHQQNGNEGASISEVVDSLPLPKMLLVESDLEVHPDPLASYRAPIDAVDLATADSSALSSPSFKEFMAMCAKPSSKS